MSEKISQSDPEKPNLTSEDLDNMLRDAQLVATGENVHWLEGRIRSLQWEIDAYQKGYWKSGDADRFRKAVAETREKIIDIKEAKYRSLPKEGD